MKSPVVDGLREIQKEHGWLPVEALQALANRIEVPLYRLQGVASFFPTFKLSTPPTVEVKICGDMSCHRRGSDALRRAIETRYGDRGAKEIVIHHVSCLGQCDRAPAALINAFHDHGGTVTQHEAIVSGLTADKLGALIEDAASGRALPHHHSSPLSTRLKSDPYDRNARYGALRNLVKTRDVAGVLAALKASELKGMGGAGFPTALKWDLMRGTPGTEKYIVCNADESEPGTIKDRFIMEYVPHLLIEGMIIAGLVTGAKVGIIYIRHEYELQAEVLEREIEECKKQGITGPDVLGSGQAFDLSVFVSPGGYICGEESALLEAMEGKRGEPRNKPPFPGQVGLFNKPTVINNVETFSNVPVILHHGTEGFKALGRAPSAGLKFVGISGDIVRPGVYEIQMGTPAREMIYDIAGGIPNGRTLKGWAPSGPSSGYLPASMIDIPLDFKALADVGSMLGSGAIVICDDTTCMVDMAYNSVRFFKNESCGKCVPCRLGTARLAEMLEEIMHGRGRKEHLDMIHELGDAMALASICGLGQIAPAPIASVIKNFPQEVEDHIVRHRCPAGVCPMA
jgi:NADH:ubiquinone oxidoreductase subunit F (NADH-binding)/NADH:ubiquinone oxidoreductase subunit E